MYGYVVRRLVIIIIIIIIANIHAEATSNVESFWSESHLKGLITQGTYRLFIPKKPTHSKMVYSDNTS